MGSVFLRLASLVLLVVLSGTSRTVVAAQAGAAPVQAPQQNPGVYIYDSEAIDYARMIARSEGFDLADRRVEFGFDVLDMGQAGYKAVGFDVGVHPVNLFMINTSTGQVIDYNSCEVFDYPNLQRFQLGIRRITKAPKKTPEELADDIGCIGATPTVRQTPIPIRTGK